MQSGLENVAASAATTDDDDDDDDDNEEEEEEHLRFCAVVGSGCRVTDPPVPCRPLCIGSPSARAGVAVIDVMAWFAVWSWAFQCVRIEYE